jgi:hypothetical protein
MRPEIEAYLRTNGARYTTKALRQQLLHAGYEAPEVDAALEETEAARAPQLAATKALRSQFWGLAFGMNLVVLIVVSAVVSDNSPYAGATFVVLGIAMLIGLGISGSIGSAFLSGRGLLVALAVPAVAALILGGTCFAMMGGVGVTQHPSTGAGAVGTMTLTIDPPLAFTGSGTAQCDDPAGINVASFDLGSVDGKVVSVDMFGFGPDQAASGQSPDPVPSVVVQISILDKGTGLGAYYGSSPEDPSSPVQTAADGSWSATFEGLEKLTDSPDPNFGPDTISGTISWTC